MSIEGSYGIDYLTGEEECIGKGIGKKMIVPLLDKVFLFPDAQIITDDIDKENKVSERVLLSCGFTLFDAESICYILYRNNVWLKNLRMYTPYW